MTHRIMEIRSVCKKQIDSGHTCYSFLILGKELFKYLGDCNTAKNNIAVRFIHTANGHEYVTECVVKECCWLGVLCENTLYEAAFVEVVPQFDSSPQSTKNGGTDEIEVTIPPAGDGGVASDGHREVYSVYI